MSAHTAGPWEAHDDDGTGTLPCVLVQQTTTAGNFYVAQCNVYADATLIAAAPDMLAALGMAREELVKWLDFSEGKDPDCEAILAEVDAALNKARGKE